MVLALFSLAACLYAARQVLLIRANRGVKVPLWWGQPERVPTASRILTALAVVAVFLAAINRPDRVNLWLALALGAVLISVAIFLPIGIVQVTDGLAGRRHDDHDPRNADSSERGQQ
jgi:hypothetical protein